MQPTSKTRAELQADALPISKANRGQCECYLHTTIPWLPQLSLPQLWHSMRWICRGPGPPSSRRFKQQDLLTLSASTPLKQVIAQSKLQALYLSILHHSCIRPGSNGRTSCRSPPPPAALRQPPSPAPTRPATLMPRMGAPVPAPGPSQLLAPSSAPIARPATPVRARSPGDCSLSTAPMLLSSFRPRLMQPLSEAAAIHVLPPGLIVPGC